MGVLLVVVYLTILRPNDDNSVSGVNVPGGVPSIATNAPQRPHHHRPASHHRAHHQPPRRHASAPAAGGAPPAAVAPVPAPVGGSVPTSSPSPAPGQSPTDDQYDSTLARLKAALH